ncbi:uncharacterized protein A1O5_02439 [Cladophialophora psammophila CBS 110553]|uniref:Uncharacterized protein n=1 Tax=Cladophialophora psammophila CBS 110553 TaxID=1182543 RepID=W9X9Y7_9EURO|nr:uncharacterized protein A1O5_02439 [Cladophialophora psammophila CBS 110553]EXJ74145.1 hypothetical protein A1O5_02439 [Cladophialophora psammophila CBS 110553]
MASSIFHPFLSPSLSALLSHLPSSIPLDTLSRTPLSRLQRTALPNIGLIELVSATDFSTLYDSLYIHSFSRLAERERSDLIVDRLAAQAKGDRKFLAPYRIVGIRDHQGEAIAAAQFSVLPVPPRKGKNSTTSSADCGGNDGSGEGSKYAVPYLQYIYVRRQNRRQDMSEVLHTMVLAVAAADAALMDMEDGISSSAVDPLLRAVPFTLFETEPPDHGDDHASRAYALERSKIHTSTGGMALVLRRRRPRPSSRDTTRPEEEEEAATAEGQDDDEILSAHVQPGLEPSDPPLTLVWIIRPAPTATPGLDYDLTSLGKALVAAYYQSLRDEGFPEKNIRLAERIVQERCRGSTFQLMPLGDVRDLSADKGNLDIRE